MNRVIARWVVFIVSMVGVWIWSSKNTDAQVFNGQPVNATVTNNAFWKRSVDDSATGIYSLANILAASGASVTNMQREFNACSSYTGLPLNSVFNILPAWSNNDVGSSTDNLKTRADLLTFKFNATAGHTHTGALGDAPQLSDASITTTANISRSKIATGIPNYVVFNNAITGKLDQEVTVAASQGGTNAVNSTPLTWAAHNLNFNLAADTSVTLPASGTLIRTTDLSATSPIQYNSGTGAFSFANSGVGPGTYTNATVTVNAQGLVTGASSGTSGLSSSLTNSHIFVGNGSNIATDVPLSGDATLSNTGAMTLANTTVTPGSYTNTNLTVDSKGRITLASNGGASSGAVPVYFEMSGGVTVDGNMGPPDEAEQARTVSKIACTMRESGSTGSTIVQVDYGPALASSTLVTITANGTRNYAEYASPGIVQAAHDYLDAHVTQVATGAINAAPEDLRCKFIF